MDLTGEVLFYGQKIPPTCWRYFIFDDFIEPESFLLFLALLFQK